MYLRQHICKLYSSVAINKKYINIVGEWFDNHLHVSLQDLRAELEQANTWWGIWIACELQKASEYDLTQSPCLISSLKEKESKVSILEEELSQLKNTIASQVKTSYCSHFIRAI